MKNLLIHYTSLVFFVKRLKIKVLEYLHAKVCIFFLTLFLLLTCMNSIFLQQIPYRNYEIINSNNFDLINDVGKSKRSIDDAIILSTNLNEKTSGNSVINKAENAIKNMWLNFKHEECFDITMKYSSLRISGETKIIRFD